MTDVSAQDLLLLQICVFCMLAADIGAVSTEASKLSRYVKLLCCVVFHLQPCACYTGPACPCTLLA